VEDDRDIKQLKYAMIVLQNSLFARKQESVTGVTKQIASKSVTTWRKAIMMKETSGLQLNVAMLKRADCKATSLIKKQ
jgi:hypothetical protein